METMTYYITLAMSGITAISIISFVSLKGFHGWLDLKKAELNMLHPEQEKAPASHTGNRIELADLKERVRKLEAIAAGVDL